MVSLIKKTTVNIAFNGEPWTRQDSSQQHPEELADGVTIQAERQETKPPRFSDSAPARIELLPAKKKGITEKLIDLMRAFNKVLGEVNIKKTAFPQQRDQ